MKDWILIFLILISWLYHISFYGHFVGCIVFPFEVSFLVPVFKNSVHGSACHLVHLSWFSLSPRSYLLVEKLICLQLISCSFL